MAISLPDHKVIQFAKNVDLVPQQKRNRLVSFVDADLAWMEAGDRYTDESMGLSDPEETLQDIAPTPGGKIDKFRRWAFFKTYQDGKWVGTQEKAEQLVDPTNPTVMAMGAGRERRRDSTVMSAFYDDQWATDENGDPVRISLPSSQIIAVNDWTFYKGKADGGGTAPTADSGLTVPKLRKAKVIAAKHQVEDFDGMWCIGVEEEDLQNLLTSVEASSQEYNPVRALVDGERDVYQGFKFVKLDPGRVRASGSNYSLPLWHTANIKYKERPLTQTRVGERADYSYNWHAFYKAQDSTLRRFDTGVINMLVKR